MKKLFAILKNKKIFILIIALLVVGSGFYWQEPIKEFLLAKKEALLSRVVMPPTEPLEIKLPEVTEEEAEEEILEEEPIEGPIGDGQPPEALPFLPEEKPEEPKLTLVEVQTRVEEISGKVELISQKVAVLKEISEEKPISQIPPEEIERELQLVEIQTELREISQRIEVISQRVAELAQAS